MSANDAGDLVTADEDRMWNIRDAVLLWLYREAIAGNRMPRYNLSRVQETAGWAAAPITSDEWASATNYLLAEEYIEGQAGWGSGVSRPKITSRGENKASLGESVRPGKPVPANTTGVTNHINITTNAPSQVAIGSSDFTQTLTVGNTDDELTAVADLLEKFAAGGYGNAAQANAVAEEIRDAATDPATGPEPLRNLLSKAIATVGIAGGTELARQVVELSVSAIQSLGS